MLSHVSNWIAIWCYISLVCAQLGWIDGNGCGWGCGDQVTIVSNAPIRSFLSSRAMVFRLEPSMIDFSSMFLTRTCSMNTFIQYRIWDSKGDSRDIAWVLSCPFPTVPSCVFVLFSAVSATSALVRSHACSLLISIAPPVVWVGVTVGWESGAIVAVASVRVAMAACVCLKDFSAFTQYTAISWDLDELYSTILFSINGGTGA